MKKVAAGASREFVVAKVNTETLAEIAGAFTIRSIPAFVLFTGAHEVERTHGTLPAAQLRAFASRAADHSIQ